MAIGKGAAMAWNMLDDRRNPTGNQAVHCRLAKACDHGGIFPK